MQTQTNLKENTDLFVEYLINVRTKENLSELSFISVPSELILYVIVTFSAGLQHHNTPMVLKNIADIPFFQREYPQIYCD